MCTLSFVPRARGYAVAMNRDERTTRAEALPPRVFHVAGTSAVYPHEPGGGTWIAANQLGVTLAVLNLGASTAPKRRSRGEIIPALISSRSLAQAEAKLRGLDLVGILPFRLVGIFGSERRVAEWRWDGRDLSRTCFPWRRRHWFSSGLSDEQARRGRAPLCHLAWRQRTAGTLGWLRRLHRSHGSGPGPFSICVHRPDAGTRSLTEVLHRPSGARMRYQAGQPCRPVGPVVEARLPRAREALRS